MTAASGDAFVEGFFYRNDAPLALSIATANATNPRIDTVVVRLDRTANTAVLAVITGTAAATPVAPTLSQTDSLYELPLADVRVPAAAGVIAAADVTDRRKITQTFDSAAYVAQTLADAKGDLLAASGPDVLVRVPVGANGQVLTADSAAAAGVAWAVVASSFDPASVRSAFTTGGESTTSDLYVDLATITSTPATIAASGRALVLLTSSLNNGTTHGRTLMSVAVTGASTLAASDVNAILHRPPAANIDAQLTAAFMLTGLTAGSNTFTAKYRVDAGTTGTFFNRRIVVIPL